MTNNKLLETFILHTVRKTIQGKDLQEVLRGFNLNHFKKLPTNLGKIRYAKSMLPHIGQGSARTVYAVSGDRVLKIAMNHKGIAQNQAEVDVFLEMDQAGFGSVVAKAIDYDPKYHWILSEAEQPFTRGYDAEQTFEKKTGVTFSLFRVILRSLHSFPLENIGLLGRSSHPTDFSNKLEKIAENPPFILKALEYAMRHLNLLEADLTHIEHYGKTADGRIVLLDYGFTHDVQMRYYE